MNIALITAGGIGSRLSSVGRPKQFANVLGKPIIIYTLEQFNMHPDVDVIAVICLEGWDEELNTLAARHGINKLKHIIPGGASNQESIRNGIMELSKHYSDDAFVLVHDAVRPMVTKEIISDCLEVAHEKGNAIASLSSMEPLLKLNADEESSSEYYSRSGLVRAQAPQCFRLDTLLQAHRQAQQKGITDTTCCATLMQRLGEQLYISKSSTRNIKITRKDDIVIFEAMQKKALERPNQNRLLNINPNKLVSNGVIGNDIKQVWESEYIDWEQFRDSTIYVTGATGHIGSFIVRCLLDANVKASLNLHVVASARSWKKCAEMFHTHMVKYCGSLSIHKADINKRIGYMGKVDHIIHAACPTDSSFFVNQPKETWTTIVEGTKNVLEFARAKRVKSMVYLSSMEALGFIESTEPINEDTYGAIDPAVPRNSYMQGKREAELMCKQYAEQYGVPVRIARLAQVICSNVHYNDNHAYTQFARSVVEKTDIILKTKGDSIRSACYISDAASALLLLLQKGKDGEVYHVANESFTCQVVDIARMLTRKYPASSLQWDLEGANNYPSATHWNLSASKLKALGWQPGVSLLEAYSKLVSSLYYQRFSKASKKASKWIKSMIKWGIRKTFSVFNRGDYKIFAFLGMELRFKHSKSRSARMSHLSKKPIKKGKIVFANLRGASYACNPKYITEEIVRRNLNWELVWLTNNVKRAQSLVPPGVRVASFDNKSALKELSDAHIWIDNFSKFRHVRYGLRKRPEQVYINTWHGSFGIKKLDKHVAAFTKKANQEWVYYTQMQSAMVDYLITHSTFEDELLPDALWYSACQTKRFGHPRNDVFFLPAAEQRLLKEKVCTALDIPVDKKIIMYAPTFRESRVLDCFFLDTERLLDTLGHKWVIITRMHDRMKGIVEKIFNYDDRVINASSYPDIQELMVAADAMITDYSSGIFDFLLTKRPGFIFATDIETYNTDRGFYFPLEATPFPIARNNDELIYNISHFNQDAYNAKVEAFLADKGSCEDGNASKRVVDFMQGIIESVPSA